jgi:hypothetical protein
MLLNLETNKSILLIYLNERSYYLIKKVFKD